MPCDRLPGGFLLRLHVCMPLYWQALTGASAWLVERLFMWAPHVACFLVPAFHYKRGA